MKQEPEQQPTADKDGGSAEADAIVRESSANGNGQGGPASDSTTANLNSQVADTTQEIRPARRPTTPNGGPLPTVHRVRRGGVGTAPSGDTVPFAKQVEPTAAPPPANDAGGLDYDLDGIPDQPFDMSRRVPLEAETEHLRAKSHVVTRGGHLSVGELERLEEIRSHRHPGDRFVRRVRPTETGFKRVGPGHLEALEDTMRSRSSGGRVAGALKRAVIGSPLSTSAAAHERLSKLKALAVLSSDALSSVTYATEAILATLFVAGSAAFVWGIPLAVAISILIGIVVFSYRQTIYAYPKGGGTYIVSKDNLGTLPGLVGGASLLIGYILTVAVSIAAGVANLISLVANVSDVNLDQFRVEIALVAVVVLVLLNLRGISESGTIFSLPTYIFLVLMFGMIALGIVQYFLGNIQVVTNIPDVVPPTGTDVAALAGPALALLLIRAFASGCAALTGIEAISDGVAAFEKPEAKNAATTLTILGVLLAIMFLGISFLAEHTHVQISETETVVSQIGRTIFGPGPVYSLFLVFTALLLVLAANTAFADFPRLGYFLARDHFLPHQFTFRGDRLAFSFGIITLGFMAGLLVVIFGGNIEGLLPLYAIGVFIGFTLSQSGMVRRWARTKPKGWQLSLSINALGALTTGVVALILAFTNFTKGAWIVLIVVPALVLLFMRINKHYTELKKQTSLSGVDPSLGRMAIQGAVLPSALESVLTNEPNAARVRVQPGETAHPLQHLVLMPVSGVNQVTLRTLTYARSLTKNVIGVHVAGDEEPEDVEAMEKEWHEWFPDVPLVIVDSPYRSLTRPLLAYIDALQAQDRNRILTVMVPEFVARRWWEHLLHNQTALRLKGSLLFRPGIVVTSVPYHLDS